MSSVHQVFLAVIRRFLKANFKKSIVLSYDQKVLKPQGFRDFFILPERKTPPDFLTLSNTASPVPSLSRCSCRRSPAPTTVTQPKAPPDAKASGGASVIVVPAPAGPSAARISATGRTKTAPRGSTALCTWRPTRRADPAVPSAAASAGYGRPTYWRSSARS